MKGRIRRVSSHHRRSLVDGWAICATAAGLAKGPDQVAQLPSSEWVGGLTLGTAAQMLRQAGLWSIDGPPRRFDAQDWWFRCQFTVEDLAGEGPLVLGLDGIATVAEVWLNGEAVMQSSNMFVGHEIDAGRRLLPTNDLFVCCRSIDQELQKRRPRPRWRAPMVEHQQLRWIRTTLLGRTPGWSPPVAAVGLWRDVWIERRNSILVRDCRLQASVAGCAGQVSVDCGLDGNESRIQEVVLGLSRGSRSYSTRLTDDEGGGRYRGDLSIEHVDLWWPHTHGDPALYEARLTVHCSGQQTVEIELGPIGFRTVELESDDGQFSLSVNGVRIFCRGACWTPLDVVQLRSTQAAYDRALVAVRDAGMNMLRVSGTMVYEDSNFLDSCDRHGVLIWQDLMFANMDYPQDDASFRSSIELEITQQLQLLQAHACVAVVCGNSEVEQQAAMWGSPRDSWEPSLFYEDIPCLVRRYCAGTVYWPSSAHGGVIPHQLNEGSTSYFGVGAYLRPLDDARRSGVRFASESLAFANVPADSTISRMPGSQGIRVHHPNWKQRSPRDLGAGWDFDDVRDFYFGKLFGTEPLAIRYSNHDRYMRLSRVLTGEIMFSALTEWRRSESVCNGALILFLRDLWAGAGWGLLDDQGVPKACYHYVKRACQPISVALSDEGCNGLQVHVWNDRGSLSDASLEIALFRADGARMAHAVKPLTLAPHSALSVPAAGAFETALDLSDAFRFSDAAHSTIVASLRDERGELLAQAFHLHGSLASEPVAEIGLTAEARPVAGGYFDVSISSQLCAHAVHFDIQGYYAKDEYFHVAPGGERVVRLAPINPSAAAPHSGQVVALNCRKIVNIEWLS